MKTVKVSAKWQQRLQAHGFKSRATGKFTNGNDILGKRNKQSIVIKRDVRAKLESVKKRSVKVNLPIGAFKKSAQPNFGDHSQMSDDPSHSEGRMREEYGSLSDKSDVNLQDFENIGLTGTAAQNLGKTSAKMYHDPNGDEYIIMEKDMTTGKFTNKKTAQPIRTTLVNDKSSAGATVKSQQSISGSAANAHKLAQSMQQQRDALQATPAFQEKDMSGKANLKQAKIPFQ